MSLSVIPLVILGQITGASVNDDASLYQVTFKDINGDPLYGVTAVWTDEQAEIEALAAQKPYGVWINPIDGTFTVKFAGYTYVGSADLTDDDVLAGVTPIEFTSAEVSDRLLPEEPLVLNTFPEEFQQILMAKMQNKIAAVITANGSPVLISASWYREVATDVEAFDSMADNIKQIASSDKRIGAYFEENGTTIIRRDVHDDSEITNYTVSLPASILFVDPYYFNIRYDNITADNNLLSPSISALIVVSLLIDETSD